MAQLLTKKSNDQSWDYQIYLHSLWLDHLKNDNSGIYESSIIHGVDCPRGCCSHIFTMEVRKKK